MDSNGTIKVKVYRTNPDVDNSHYYDEYAVPLEHGMSVLNALTYIYENLDQSLAIPYSCRIGRCGYCTLMVNDKPTLICTSMAQASMTIEPLPSARVVKDLITDKRKKE